MISSSIPLHNFWCCKLCSHFTNKWTKTNNFKDVNVWFKIFALLKTIHVHSCETSLSKSRTHSYETHAYHALRWTLSIFEWDCLQISTRSLKVCIFFYKKIYYYDDILLPHRNAVSHLRSLWSGFLQIVRLVQKFSCSQDRVGIFFHSFFWLQDFSSHYCSGSPGCICGDCNIQIKGTGETPRRQMELETCFIFLA